MEELDTKTMTEPEEFVLTLELFQNMLIKHGEEIECSN